MTISYGIIGCGEHAVRSHLIPALKTKLVLTAVFDPNPNNVTAALRAAGGKVKVCQTETELYASDIQAVVIGSPDQFHPEQLHRAIAAGKHVLVDKPLAIDEAGLAIVTAALAEAAQRGLVVSSCHPRRFDPPYVAVKDMLRLWWLKYGSLVQLGLDFSYHAPREDWKHDRSLLLDHFPHEIDYLRFLIGNLPFTAYPLHDSYDHYSVAGSMVDGPTFVFTGTRRLGSSIYPEEIILRFDRGTITVNTKTGQLGTYDHETQSWSSYETKPTDYEQRFQAITDNFCTAIQREAECYLTPADLMVNASSSVELATGNTYDYIPNI